MFIQFSTAESIDFRFFSANRGLKSFNDVPEKTKKRKRAADQVPFALYLIVKTEMEDPDGLGLTSLSQNHQLLLSKEIPDNLPLFIITKHQGNGFSHPVSELKL